MKIFTYGIEQLTVNALKSEGYHVIVQNRLPDVEQVEGHLMIVSSSQLSVDQLQETRMKYKHTTFLYHYLKKGVRGYKPIHMLCESLNVHFISPMATAKTFLDKIRLLLEEESISDNRIIGFFGSGPGIGCTSVAATFSKKMAAAGKKVIMLGLNLYDPGWNLKTNVSLDQWRPKITGKIIQNEDFARLLDKEGFPYLPGNFDYIAAMDYQESEIEYLLQKAKEHADIVIADFGSIPQSAAWYVGMQWSEIRYYVAHTKHHTRLKELLSLTSHLDLYPSDFNLVINQSSEHDIMSPKTFQQDLGIPQLIEIPKVETQAMQLSLLLGKKDQQHIEQHVEYILAAFGMKAEEEKKRGLFG